MKLYLRLRVSTLLLFLTVTLSFAAYLPADVQKAIHVSSGDKHSFDASEFGITDDSTNGCAYGFRWRKTRKISRVVVEFAENDELPDPESVRLQYWLGSWDGDVDKVVSQAPIANGWLPMDDWTNGKWQDADARLQIDGRRWSFTFAPSGEKEFADLGGPGVGYRKMLKIRLTSENPFPKPAVFRTFTDSVVRPLTAIIMWGDPAAQEIKIGGNDSCRIEVFNGKLKAVRPIAGSNITVDDKMEWSLPENLQGGVEVDLDIVSHRDDAGDDPTIVTVRSKYRPFSFAAAELAGGRRILVDDLGVLVVRSDDRITLDELRQSRQKRPTKTVYDRVSKMPEQTLSDAWNDMPKKFPLWFVHGLPGNRNAVKHFPDGDIAISSVRQWFNVDSSPKDSARKDWDGDFLALHFGFPREELRAGRELQQGYLPMLRTWWVEGPIYYEQRAILDKLDGDTSEFRLDDPTVLLMKVRVVNTSAVESGTAQLHLSADGEKLFREGDRIMAGREGGSRLRYLLKTAAPAETATEGDGVRWSVELAPGQSQEVFFTIPTVTLTESDEIESLRQRNFDEAGERLGRMWEELADRGTQIETPELWLNHFYRAHIRHLEVNCVKDINTSWRYARVGTFSYAVFPNESIMMTADLDRRGHHKLVEDCLDGWLEYQGSVMLPGNFKTKDGLLFGSGGWEHIGYNKHHGCIMWGLADHWRMTRDRKWMERVAPKLVKACDWVTRERQATKKLNADGSKPLEYGFLPAGGLEDVQDYWYWTATNAATVWGFDALADALADYGHPEAERLQKDAKAYHDDVLRGVTEARILSPVVRLRNGTYVPKYPSRLYERGRSLGWIRETLEGSIYLIFNGLIPADSVEAAWILQDHEDNLFISDTYGYDIPNFDRFWFSRGGFSMQANLLECPAAYLERDDIKHFIRTYFNGFASAFYPDIMMCNEHSNPELGYPAGDHFKSSDEANVTTWLRLMFIREQGDDLYLGQGIPRYWLAGGRRVGIKNAPTHFGPMSLSMESSSDHKTITAVVSPPTRNHPRSILLRLRHPDGKPMKSVTLNGTKLDRFNIEKEMVELPYDAVVEQTVVAEY